MMTEAEEGNSSYFIPNKVGWAYKDDGRGIVLQV